MSNPDEPVLCMNHVNGPVSPTIGDFGGGVFQVYCPVCGRAAEPDQGQVKAIINWNNTYGGTMLKVGPDAPTVINEDGGKQSATQYRFDLIEPKTLFAIAEILHEGAEKYGEWNWKKLPINDNINHALIHIYAFLDGDTQDDHLGHAFTRLMFALAQTLDNRPESFTDNPRDARYIHTD